MSNTALNSMNAAAQNSLNAMAGFSSAQFAANTQMAGETTGATIQAQEGSTINTITAEIAGEGNQTRATVVQAVQDYSNTSQNFSGVMRPRS